MVCGSNAAASRLTHIAVIAADGLYKRDVFSMRFLHTIQDKSTCANEYLGFPDPFAVATISGEQTRTTGVIKKTLNPYWNESFDMYVGMPQRMLIAYPNIVPGESPRRAYWLSKYSTRRSSKRRIKAFWALSMYALGASSIWTQVVMVRDPEFLKKS